MAGPALFVVFLWLIGEGGQAFFSTGVGNLVALVIGLAVIVAGFGGLLVLPFYVAWEEWRSGRRRLAACWAVGWCVVLLAPLPPY